MIYVFEFDVTIYDKDDANIDTNVANVDANVVNSDANEANNDANNGTNGVNTVNEGVLNNTTDDQFICGIIFLFIWRWLVLQPKLKFPLFYTKWTFIT